jgi:hypothetical protein
MADNKSSEGKEFMIGGKRNCGKTTEMIKTASENNLYIVCATRDRVRNVANMAKDMGLDIPYPISVEELPLRGYTNEVLVDDVEDLLSRLIGKRIVGMSTSYKLKDFSKKNSVGNLTVDVDASAALTGLKALQREARKATAALKELDDIKKHTCPECNTISLNVETLTADGEIFLINKICKNCGWKS